MNIEKSQTDKILKAIAGGDKKAFEQLFREWYVRLCIYADSYLHDRDLAEDLVQNVFCLLWEKRNAIEISDSASAYLYRTIYNSALNLLKHEKVKLAFLEFQKSRDVGGENDIERFIENENHQKLMKEVSRVIQTLPGQCREIFRMSRFEGMKNQQIALELNISVRTVEVQLYRAMKRLRDELQHLRGYRLFLLFLFRQK